MENNLTMTTMFDIQESFKHYLEEAFIYKGFDIKQLELTIGLTHSAQLNIQTTFKRINFYEVKQKIKDIIQSKQFIGNVLYDWDFLKITFTEDHIKDLYNIRIIGRDYFFKTGDSYLYKMKKEIKKNG